MDNTFKSAKIKNTISIIFMAFLVAFFLLGISLGYNRYYSGKKDIVDTEWGRAEFDIPQSQEMVNGLIIGFDKGGYRTDTMMIINFNPKTSKVSMISIPRDTMVGVNGKIMKLNAVFAAGKFDLLLKTIKQYTGLPIHYYAAVDTKGFRSIIDTLDGIDFDVPCNMYYYDPYQDLKIDLKKGPQHLDGEKAEQLVRYRQYITGDLQREEVQKQFIKELIKQKINIANISDIQKMKKIYDDLNKYTQTNFSFDDGLKYLVSALKINSESFDTYLLPGEPRDINGASYYIYDKQKTLQLLSLITSKSISKLEESISNSSTITSYDIKQVNILFPYKAEQPEKENNDTDASNIEDNTIVLTEEIEPEDEDQIEMQGDMYEEYSDDYLEY